MRLDWEADYSPIIGRIKVGALGRGGEWTYLEVIMGAEAGASLKLEEVNLLEAQVKRPK